MKHIVVPVDLSPNSKDAIRYAVRLAKKSSAEITIIHNFSLLQKAVTVTTGNAEKSKDPKKWILKRIKKINVKYPDLTINFKLFKTDILKSLKKLPGSIPADLIVMGAHGEHHNTSTLLGSVSKTVVKKTPIPVILIPRGYEFNGIKNIVLAARNTFMKKPGTLEPISEISHQFKSHIHLLHLGLRNDRMLKSSFSILPRIHDTIRYETDQVIESINDYLHSHATDILCLIRGKKGLITSLLESSPTEFPQLSADIPLMILIDE